MAVAPQTHPTVVILGPTAGGKSEFAVELALRLPGGGEVISADSMQIYRHMNAGTAKPPAELRDRVPHHLIDTVEPTQRFTVADWLKQAQQLITRLKGQSKTPIVVGGTNLYIKALIEGMFDGPPADDTLRQRLNDLPLSEVHHRLLEADPDAANQIHPNDRKRLVRALEVYELTGTPISQWQTQWDAKGVGSRVWGVEQGTENSSAESNGRPPQTPDPRPQTPFILIGLQWPVEAINRRINKRVKAMFFPNTVDPTLAQSVVPAGESLQDETKRLYEAGSLGDQAAQALGYKQVISFLEGRSTLDDAFERTKILTRRYAKQQRTWLRRFGQVHWLSAPDRSASELADESATIVSAYI